MKSPKFKIGQKVTHKPDLYQQTESEVVEITRCFWNGDKYSRAYLERDLKNLRDDIEWEIIDNTLIIYPYMSSEWSCKAGKFIPAMTQKREIPFHHHGYTVENSKMRTLFPERSLKLKK